MYIYVYGTSFATATFNPIPTTLTPASFWAFIIAEYIAIYGLRPIFLFHPHSAVFYSVTNVYLFLLLRQIWFASLKIIRVAICRFLMNFSFLKHLRRNPRFIRNVISNSFLNFPIIIITIYLFISKSSKIHVSQYWIITAKLFVISRDWFNFLT